MDKQAVRDIVATYEKHGWTLRRVLLSGSIAEEISDIVAGAAIISSKVDAAWFSRGRTDGGTAWEIRYLGSTQYALVTVVDDDAETESELARLEADLIAAVSRQPTGH